MAPLNQNCGEPPSIKSFNVADIGDTYAILQWSSETIKSKYIYELKYYSLNNPYESIIMHLPHSQKLVLLKDLISYTNYTSTLLTTNDCDKSSIPLELIFETKNTTLNPTIRHFMPHEIIITVIVLFIWIMILRHFIIVYNRLALVSNFPLGNYLTRKQSNKKILSSRSTSNQTLISKTDVKPSFNILEDAVQQWRSETVLSVRKNSDVSTTNMIRNYKNYSNIQSFSSKHSQNSQLYSNNSSCRNSYSGPLICLTSTISPPDSRRPSRSNYFNVTTTPSIHSCPTDVPSTSYLTSTNVSTFQPLLNYHEDEKKDDINDSTETRKISQVLLGKATDDIRRIKADKPEIKIIHQRRKSLLDSISSISGSIRRKSKKWKRYGMESLKEERENTTTSIELSNSSNKFNNNSNNNKTKIKKLLSKTYIGTSIDSQNSNNNKQSNSVTNTSNYDFN